MQESDLALLIRAAHAAAEAVEGLARSDLNVRHKAADGSPVTDADMAANAVLHDTLRAARPDHGWLSEESVDDPARLEAQRVFIVDPIDGTRSFIEGSDSWAHSLAIAERGQITAAVVYLPKRDKLYSATLGGGATFNGAPIRVSDHAALHEARVLATRPAMDPSHWARAAPAIRRAHRPSIAYRLSLVAEGRFDAMMTFRKSWEWDIAAGALILSEAGARISDRRGADLRFNDVEPALNGVIAANPELHRDVLRHVHPDLSTNFPGGPPVNTSPDLPEP